MGDPKTAEAAKLNNRAAGLVASGKADLAVELLEKALSLDPSQAELTVNLASALKSAGRDKRALDVISRLPASASPELAADARVLEGLIHYGNKDFKAAEAAYRAALAAAPAHRDALNDLGVLLFLSGDFPGARECFESAVKADPESAEAWYNLGDACREAGDDARAAEADDRYARLSVGGRPG